MVMVWNDVLLVRSRERILSQASHVSGMLEVDEVETGEDSEHEQTGQLHVEFIIT